MNKARRKAIRQSKRDLEFIRDAEDEAFENLLESLRDSERGEQMQEAIGYLEDAIDALDYIDSL